MHQLSLEGCSPARPGGPGKGCPVCGSCNKPIHFGHGRHIGVSIKLDTPDGWFTMENPSRIYNMDHGGTPILGNLHIGRIWQQVS